MSGNEEDFPINVKSINNDIYPFTVNNATTVNELKSRIKDTTSISEDRQRLIYRGRVLADDTCIGDYRIESGHTIQFVARPENYRELQQQAASAPTVPRTAPVPVPGPLPTAGGNSFMDIIMRDILSAANFPAAPVAVRRIPATPANIANNSAAIAALQALDSEDNLEHVRQGLLTLNTIMSTMNPENFAPEVDVPIHSNSSASETAEDSDRDSPPPLIPLDSVEDEQDEEDIYTPISDTAGTEIAVSEERATKETEEQSPEVEPEHESEHHSEHHSEQDELYDDEDDEWESIPDDEEEAVEDSADFEVQREEIQAERRRIAARAAEMRSSSNSNSNSNGFNGSNKQFYIGQWVDCKDTVQTWLEATVMNVDERNRKVFIHYNGWPSERWDEWISMDSPRLSPFRSRTVHSNTTHPQFISPAPNCRTARQPVTGYDDVRTLLPQLASMFRRLQPVIEEAAELAEQSLREDANYPPGSAESLAAPEGTEPLLPIAAGMPWDAVVRHSALYSAATGVASSNNNALSRAAEFLTEAQSQRRPVSARDAHSPHRTGDIWTPEEIQSVPVRSALPQRVPLSFTSASPGRPLRTAANDNEDEERDEANDNNDNNGNEENEESDSDSDDEDQQQEQQRTIDLIHNIMGGLVAAQGNLNAAANGGAGTGGTVRTTQTPTEGNAAPQSEFGAFLSAATVPFARTYTVSADGSVNAVEIPATQQPAMTLQQLAQSPLSSGSQSTAAAGGASGSTAQTSDPQQGPAARPVVTQPTGPGGLPVISIQSEEAMASFMNSLLAGSGITMIPPPGRQPAIGSAGGSSAQSAGQSTSSTSNLDPSMMHNEAEEEYNYFFNLLSPDANGAAASTGSSSAPAVEQGRDARLRYLTREMTPLLDRFGRVLSDISPHLHAFSERNIANDANNSTEASAASSSGNGSNNSAVTEPFFATSEGLRNDMTLQQNLISLMRRPPSPPPDRAYRSPLRVQQLPETTRISTGIPAGSSGSGVYLASPGIGQQPRLVSLVGGNGIASILGQQMQGGVATPATSAATSTAGVAQQQSGGQPPRVQMRVLSISSSGNQSTTTNATGAATTTPASSTTRTVANTAVPQPIDSAVIQSLSNRATQLQAQVQDIAQRSQELSERTTAATNYSHQLNEIIRGIHTVEEIRDSRRRIQEISAQIDAIRARALGAQSTSSVTETEPLLPDATTRSDSQPNEEQHAAEIPDLVTVTNESSSSATSASVASTSVANTSVASSESGGAERTASMDINLDSTSAAAEEGEDNIEALFMQGIRRFLDQETERRPTEESLDEEQEVSDEGDDDEDEAPGLLDDLDVHTHAVAHPTLLEPTTAAVTSQQISSSTNNSTSNSTNSANSSYISNSTSGGLAGVRPLMECNEHRMNESITQNLQFYNRNLVPPTATDLVVEDLETCCPEAEQSRAAAVDASSGVVAAQSTTGDSSEDVTTEQTTTATAIVVDEEPSNNQQSPEPNRSNVTEQSLVGESSAAVASVDSPASEEASASRVNEESANPSNSAADVSGNANSPTSGNRRPSFFQRVKSSLSFKGNNKET